MTEEEVGRFFGEIERDVRNENGRYRQPKLLFCSYARFLMETGVRREEGLTLKPESVDFDNRLLYARGQKSK